VDNDLVQKQLTELAQQVVHVIQAWNEEKGILVEEFNSLRNGIMIMESQLQTEKGRIYFEVSAVAFRMQFQETILQELRSGVHILQGQDNHIVEEVTDLFAGIR
jgi:nitrous oxidase accessory protein NosD